MLRTELDRDTRAEQLANDIRAGLSARPKVLPPKYFYDAAGSALFDEITRLPEYYPTRTERAILLERAAQIAQLTRAQTLLEIGSGTSDKTRLLLDALTSAGTLRRFVAFDVDPHVLAGASESIAAQYPAVQVQTVVGDFEHHLAQLPRHPRQLVAFLGSTIGNLDDTGRVRFLRGVRESMSGGDALLLGTDLVKDIGRLVRAYDDAAGVTARFNKNVLLVINRELGADFDADAFSHIAVWNAEHEWIEMRLRSRRDQTVHIPALDMQVHFESGEQMRTEISAKFRRRRVAAELGRAGMQMVRWWTDPIGDFALSLAVPITE